MPADTPPVPADCHVGVQFSASAITAATSKRCKLLGQGACGRVTAAEYPAATPAPAPVPAGAGPSTAAGVASGVVSTSTTTGGGNNDTSTICTSNTTTNSSSFTTNGSSSSSSVLRPRRVAIKTALPSPGNRRSLMVEAKALAHTAHPAGAGFQIKF